MRKLLALLTLALLPIAGMADEPKGDNSDKLVVVWTSGDPALAHSMVLMYAHNAKRVSWFDEVTLIIWGPSAKLSSEDEKIQAKLALMIEDGIKIEACVACADMYGVTDKLKELGYDVKPMGKPLTDYLKAGHKVLTF